MFPKTSAERIAPHDDAPRARRRRAVGMLFGSLALVTLAACQGDATPPSPVSSLEASPSISGVVLSWTHAADDYTGALIRRADGETPPATPTEGTLVADVPWPDTIASDTGLTPATTYSYAVFAHDASDNYATAATITVTTLTGAETVPGVPTIGTATNGSSQATVTWTAPGSDGGAPVTHYVVTPFIGAVAQPARVFPAPATSQVVTGLTNGTSYTFRVAARNPVGTSALSTASNAVTPASAPGAPTIGATTPGNTQVTVSWTAPGVTGGGPITGYRVTPYIGAVAQTPVDFASTLTTQTVTGLTNGTAYTFRVAATNVIGTGAASAASAVTTPATTPGTPTIGAAVAGNSEATLSWTAPVTDGGAAVTGYRVTPFIGAVAQTPQDFASTATTQVVTGLTNATAYTFRVAATNAAGTGSTSDASNSVTPVADATAVAAGATHTCALPGDGTVKCWGTNASGQLGTGDTLSTTTPTEVVDVTTATAIASGGSHTCALLSTGSISCWGNNDFGQLGDTTTESSHLPVTVDGITTATAISAGTSHTCARLVDSTVRCWGANGSGQLGNGTTTQSATPVAVSGFSNGTTVSAGATHTCARRSNGTIRCWGDNSSGQLGNGNTNQQLTPVNVSGGITTYTSVSAGAFHTCALLVDGTTRCWGSNSDGQLGNGSFGANAGSTVPVTNGLTGVGSLTSGSFHSCARLTNATMQCWGNNSAGQLGNGTTQGSTVPVPVSGITLATTVSANEQHTCAIAVGVVKCWGGNVSGQLGVASPISQVFPVTITGIATATEVSSGGSHTCARLSDTTVQCWGANASGQLGNGTTTLSRVPVAVTGLTGVTSISSGEQHTCAVLVAGTVKCWGDNTSGQLGNGSFGNGSNAPVTVNGITTATAVSVGEYHSCALLSGGTIRCWGLNDFGALGNGTTSSSTIPVTVTGLTTATYVTSGSYHTCALLADLTLRCWGYNTTGQLGNGSTTASSTPVTVSGLNSVSTVRAGSYHSCAILSNANVRCWGSNAYGALGDGTTVSSSSPVAVSGITTATSLGLGGLHSCARLEDATLTCWGYNAEGELGDGETVSSALPAVVAGIDNAASVSGGTSHTCAVLATGAVRCWGNNATGALGIGGIELSTTPITVSGV